VSALPLRVLLAPNPSPMTLDGTRTYVIGRSRPVVIDPGPADPRHLLQLRNALEGSVPAAILLTHHHPDHAAAAPRLAGMFEAPVVMGRGALEVGFPVIPVDRWVGDGEVVETDVGPVRAITTPGHTPEHLAFFWSGSAAPAGGALFVGDLFMGTGDTTLIAPPEGDLAAYLDSLARVRELKPGILYPTHGPPLEDAAEAVARFARHREERVAQVMEALRHAEAARPRELVDRIYGPELDPRLRAAAEGSIRAILLYLDDRHYVRAGGDDRKPLVEDQPTPPPATHPLQTDRR
jgi:glyoxylase-like metal-dependent hydrolase (beta-lactamase superfamily II)